MYPAHEVVFVFFPEGALNYFKVIYFIRDGCRQWLPKVPTFWFLKMKYLFSFTTPPLFYGTNADCTFGFFQWNIVFLLLRIFKLISSTPSLPVNYVTLKADDAYPIGAPGHCSRFVVESRLLIFLCFFCTLFWLLHVLCCVCFFCLVSRLSLDFILLIYGRVLVPLITLGVSSYIVSELGIFMFNIKCLG